MLGGGGFLNLRRDVYYKSELQCVCAPSLVVQKGGVGGFINRAVVVIELFFLSNLNLKLL